jgi:hypothetical protein
MATTQPPRLLGVSRNLVLMAVAFTVLFSAYNTLQNYGERGHRAVRAALPHR